MAQINTTSAQNTDVMNGSKNLNLTEEQIRQIKSNPGSPGQQNQSGSGSNRQQSQGNPSDRSDFGGVGLNRHRQAMAQDYAH